MQWRRRGRTRQNRRPETSDTLVFRVLASLGLSDIAIRLHIDRVWEQAVGRSVAGHIQPTNFSRGKLTLATQTSTWQQQMHFLRPTIMSNVNAKLHRPYVTEITLVIRSARRALMQAETMAPPPAPPPPEPSPAEQQAALQCAQAIGDQEIRALFARTMAKQLARLASNQSNQR